jgi:hypothetical protein
MAPDPRSKVESSQQVPSAGPVRSRLTLSTLAPAGLVVAAIFVGSHAASQQPSSAFASVEAQEQASVPAGRTPPFNSAAERQAILLQLTQINEKLTRVEAKLNAGVSVKVTEMPAITVKNLPVSEK